MIADDYVLVELHRSAVEVILQSFLNVLAVLLYMRLSFTVLVHVYFQVALDDLINFLAIESVEKHAVLQTVPAHLLHHGAQLIDRIHCQLDPFVRIQVLKLLLEVDGEVLAQFGPVSNLWLVPLVLIPISQVVSHVGRFVGGHLGHETRLIE